MQQVQKMQNCSFSEDGWDSTEQLKVIDVQQSHFIRFRGEKGRNVIDSNFYSLQPDMISGWRPKLPSCPLPLSYINPYVDSLKNILANNNLYSIVYLGPRPSNSVQVNQKYSYFWKYRQRYNLNFSLIRKAVDNVGNQPQKELKIGESSHIFDSSFESGNLDMAIKVLKNQYDCFIRSDSNTKGHSNWYYFKVKNKEKIGLIKLNICNMTKYKNLYTQGMKPFCKIGSDGQWSQQHCQDVKLVQRLCRYGLPIKTYQLQFVFNFTEPYQQVYFAYSIPYTYSDLQNFLTQIRGEQNIKISKLCQSLGGVNLPLITINKAVSSQNDKQNKKCAQKGYKKKVILMTARIHPGQSNSSYLLEGFVKYLLNSSNYLLNNFVFYIIPMLNPDGVIIGNFRTSYSGKDLNRQFKAINKHIFPEIYAIQQLCQSIKKSYHSSIQFYFDFHGHSSKKDLFCYGPQHCIKDMYYFKSRALAKIIEKIDPVFNYKNSIFTISQQKKTTARAYMLRKHRIPMTFTFQISNGLLSDCQKGTIHLDKKEILKAGQSIVKSLQRYAIVQMKIQKKQIQAKVDSGKYQTRKMKIVSSAPRIKLNSQEKLRHNYIKYPNNMLANLTRKQIQSLQQQFQQPDNQFLEIMKQIKNQNAQKKLKKQQGGSDSQASSQDFNAQQSNKLFDFIQNKRNMEKFSKYTNNKFVDENYIMKIESLEENENIMKCEFTQNKRYLPTKSTWKQKGSARPNTAKKYTIQKYKIPVVQKHFTMFI